jgi:hypothetical protein
MSLRLPYQPVPLTGPPPPTLPASTSSRRRPLIPVRVVAPLTGRFRDFNQALVDSGADDTIFPLGLAGALGVALLPDPSGGHSIRWAGSSYVIRYGEVGLEVTDGVSTLSWAALVAVSSAPVRYPLLGQTGFLRFLNVAFLGEDRALELETNPSFQGTTA